MQIVLSKYLINFMRRDNYIPSRLKINVSSSQQYKEIHERGHVLENEEKGEQEREKNRERKGGGGEEERREGGISEVWKGVT